MRCDQRRRLKIVSSKLIRIEDQFQKASSFYLCPCVPFSLHPQSYSISLIGILFNRNPIADGDGRRPIPCNMSWGEEERRQLTRDNPVFRVYFPAGFSSLSTSPPGQRTTFQCDQNQCVHHNAPTLACITMDKDTLRRRRRTGDVFICPHHRVGQQMKRSFFLSLTGEGLRITTSQPASCWWHQGTRREILWLDNEPDRMDHLRFGSLFVRRCTTLLWIWSSRRRTKKEPVTETKQDTKEPPCCEGGCGTGDDDDRTGTMTRISFILSFNSMAAFFQKVWTLRISNNAQRVSEMMLFQEGIIKSVPSESHPVSISAIDLSW